MDGWQSFRPACPEGAIPVSGRAADAQTPIGQGNACSVSHLLCSRNVQEAAQTIPHRIVVGGRETLRPRGMPHSRGS